MYKPTELAAFAHDSLPRMLDELLETPSALAEIAARSYTHENGFVKIILLDGAGLSPSLRLHIWPTGTEDCEGNIHNHCWDFWSYMVSGELKFEEFSPDKTGPILATHLIYDPSSGLDYHLRPVGQVRLKVIRAGTHVAGEVYSMGAETLHRTWASSNMTATLLLQGCRKLQHADVFATTDVALEAHDQPLPLSQLRSLIREVRSKLC